VLPGAGEVPHALKLLPGTDAAAGAGGGGTAAAFAPAEPIRVPLVGPQRTWMKVGLASPLLCPALSCPALSCLVLSCLAALLFPSSPDIGRE